MGGKFIGLQDLIRGNLAGTVSMLVHDAAVVLYQAGGKLFLNDAGQTVLRQAAGDWVMPAVRQLAPDIVTQSAAQGSREIVGAATRKAASRAVQAAVGQAARQATTQAAEQLTRALPVASELARSGAKELTATASQQALVAAGKQGSRALARQAAKAAGKEMLKGTGAAMGLGLLVDGAFGGVEALLAYRKGQMTKEQAARHVAKEAVTGAVATGLGVALGAGLVVLTGGVAAPVVFGVGAVGSLGAKLGLKALWR